MKQNKQRMLWLLIIVLVLNSSMLSTGMIHATGAVEVHGTNSMLDFLGAAGKQSGTVGIMATGTVHYVKMNGNGDGSSWSHALGSLHDALVGAQPGDQIWVAAGTYIPSHAYNDTIPSGDVRTKTFKMRPGVTIYGGFPADVTDGMGMEVRNWESHATILSGDLNGDDTSDLTENKGDNAFNVIEIRQNPSLEGTVILDGVTITGGYGPTNAYDAAGIKINNNSPTLRNVTIAGNVTQKNGGGLLITGGSPVLHNVKVTNNRAINGAGIYASNTVLNFVDGLVEGNRATVGGGGLYIVNNSYDSNKVSKITRVDFIDNHSETQYVGGGGIYSKLSYLELADLDIRNNSAYSDGGGIVAFGNPDQTTLSFRLDLTNVNVVGNTTAQGKGGGISVSNRGTVVIKGGEISENSVTSSQAGGGLYVHQAGFTMEDTLIRQNESFHGGGIYVGNSNAKLTNVQLLGNTAVMGGGAYISSSSPVLTNVSILGNKAMHRGNNVQGYGGGIYNDGSKPKLINALITGNVAEGNNGDGLGGGIFDRGGAFSTLTNVTLAHNYAFKEGGGFYREGGTNSTPEIYNSIIWGNKAGSGIGDNIKNANNAQQKADLTIGHSIIEGAFVQGGGWNAEYGTNGSGNDDKDPQFVAPIGSGNTTPSVAGDYRIDSTSPAVDKGNNAKIDPTVTVDLDGAPRMSNGTVDLGPYERNVDVEGPIWPLGTHELTVTPVPNTPTSVVVSWPEAQDNIAVAAYHLTIDDRQPIVFPGTIFGAQAPGVFEYTIENLIEVKNYTFRVVAKDAANNESVPLVGEYERKASEVDPPVLGDFTAQWTIARTAYPHMLAQPEQPFEIVALGDEGRTLRADVHYESWFEADGSARAIPRSFTETVLLNEDPATQGRYTARQSLPSLAGRIVALDIVDVNGGQTIVDHVDIDLLVAAMYVVTNTDVEYANLLTGGTMKLWSDAARDGSTAIFSHNESYRFTAVVPNVDYVFTFMESATNRPLHQKSIHLLPGQTYTERLDVRLPATLNLAMTFAGETIAVPDGLVVTIKDIGTNQIISRKSTDSSKAWQRPASGQVLSSSSELQLQVSGMQWPYAAVVQQNVTLRPGVNEVTINIDYAEKATIQGKVTLVGAGPLLGIQVTGVQLDPGKAHRRFVSKAITDVDGNYSIDVIAGHEVAMQVANTGKNTIVAQTADVSGTGLNHDSTITKDFAVERYPNPATVRAKIRMDYIDGQSSQVWEHEEIDWRIAVHMGITASNALGRTSTGYPLLVQADIGDRIQVCVKGREADLPDQCVEATVRADNDGTLYADAEFHLVQTGGIVEGQVLDALTNTAIDNWSGSLQLLKNGKLQGMFTNSQHGIANRGKSSAYKLWFPEAGTYQLQMRSGTKVAVQQITIQEGQKLAINMHLSDTGIFAGKENNELRIIDSEYVQGGKLNIRALYTNHENSAVEDAHIRVALPHGMTYVNNSAIWNNSIPNPSAFTMGAYDVTFHIGTIAAKETGVVQFQVMAESLAVLTDQIGTTASIQYSFGGVSRTEHLGSVDVPVVQVSLKAPSNSIDRTFFVFGSAPAGSMVDVYTDQLLLGRAKASPIGTWGMDVTLPDRGSRALYSLEAVATVGTQALSSGRITTVYDNTYPHLTQMRMGQRDGRVITIDPREGIAYFPYVFVQGQPFTYELQFSEPHMVSNVTVHMGTGAQVRSAHAVRGTDGVYRVQMNSGANGPIAINYDIDVDALPDWGSDWRENAVIPTDVELETIPQAILSEAENTRLDAADEHIVYVNGNKYGWKQIQSPVEIELDEEMLEKLIPIVIADKTYYASGLGLGDHSIAIRIFGENVDDLKIIDEEQAVGALSNMRMDETIKGLNTVSVSFIPPKLFEKIWKIQDYTAGPIRDVNNDNPSFENAVNAMNDMINEAASICSPTLRADAQRVLRGIRDRDIVDYELKVLIVTAPLNIFGGIIVDNVKNAIYAERLQQARKLLNAWLRGNDCRNKPSGSNIVADPKFIHDPSGYVYEAVRSNRVEGVQTTLLYLDPDTSNWDAWDAEWYLQRNPLITDADGRYGWDVPEGSWQVIYEKEGYETAYSKDHYDHPIVVLPPHFEVDIPIVSYATPYVTHVDGHTSGKHVDMTFSRYMALQQFDASMVVVTKNGVAATGTLAGVDTETGVDGRDLARTIRFTPDEGWQVGDTIHLTVRSLVQSYAGVSLAADYATSVQIKKEPIAPIDPGPADPAPTDPKPIDPRPTGPAQPGALEAQMDADGTFAVDPKQLQTLSLHEDQFVIRIPAGTLAADGQEVRMHVEMIPAAQAPSLPSSASLYPLIELGFTSTGADGTRTSITQWKEAIGATITFDHKQIGSVNPNKIAAFILDGVKWRYMHGVFDTKTNQLHVRIDQPGIIAIVVTDRTFPDIAGHWAQESVEVMSGRGIIEGKSSVSFDPNAPITRAEYVTLLTRLLQLPPAPNVSNRFADVNSGDWYYAAIATALSEQLITGLSDTQFAPNGSITREQIAILLHRAFTKVTRNTAQNVTGKASLTGYTDVNQVSTWAQEGIAFALERGIIKGRNAQTIAPKSEASRAEAVVMLQRFMDVLWEAIKR